MMMLLNPPCVGCCQVLTMSWTRAVWLEGEREEELSIPSNWIEDGYVRWPKVTNAAKYLQQHTEPCASWLSFPLLKAKYTSGTLYTRSHLYERKGRALGGASGQNQWLW